MMNHVGTAPSEQQQCLSVFVNDGMYTIDE